MVLTSLLIILYMYLYMHIHVNAYELLCCLTVHGLSKVTLPWRDHAARPHYEFLLLGVAGLLRLVRPQAGIYKVRGGRAGGWGGRESEKRTNERER